jgi:PelA/Pel-15E family pectate lyase
MVRLPTILFLALLAVPGLARAAAAPGRVAWADINRQPAAWYATPAAQVIADSIVQYQTPSGGWPKNRDMTSPPDAEFLANQAMDHRAATLDNEATILQLRFLGRVITATSPARYGAVFFKGFDYLLAAQYANGGWPQYFPLQEGYYTHITFNDNAMINIMEVLRDAGMGKEPYVFVDAARRTKALAAVDRAVACILRCQVVIAGVRTAWCAQHDEVTFAPAKARAYEHPSLSGSESVGIVRFLMGIEKPGPEIIAAVNAAAAWLEQARLTGFRYETVADASVPGGRNRVVILDPAGGPLWARFYELGTNRPIFSGRDSVIRYAVSEIEPERRNGYSWYGTWPRQLLEKEYPAWKQKWAPAP